MATVRLTTEELYPRTPEFRYRIYARRGDELRILAVAPDAGGLGTALVRLHEEAKEAGSRLVDEGALGVLDVVEGEWIIPCWHRKEKS